MPVRASNFLLLALAAVALGSAGCGGSDEQTSASARSSEPPAPTPAPECDDLSLDAAKSLLAEPSLTSIGDDCTYTDARDDSTLDLQIIGPDNLTDGAGTDTMTPEEFFDGTKETSRELAAPDYSEPTGLGEKAYAGSYTSEDGKGEGAVIWFADGRYYSLRWAGYSAEEADASSRLVTVARGLDLATS